MFNSIYLVSFVLVSTLLVIKSEDTVIEITIRKLNGPCLVAGRFQINENDNFTINVKSDFIINELNSTWRYRFGRKYDKTLKIKNLYDTNVSILYENCKFRHRKDYKSIQYKFSYMDKAQLNMSGNWDFEFCAIRIENPFIYHHPYNMGCISSKCSTSVKVVPEGDIPADRPKSHNGANSSVDKGGDPFRLIVIIGSVGGAIMLTQTIYIIYIQCKGRGSKRTILRSGTNETVCNNYNDRTIDIAKRPPLPLPPDDINNEGLKSPRSPALKRSAPGPISPSQQKRMDQSVRRVPAVSPKPVREKHNHLKLPMPPPQCSTPRSDRNGARCQPPSTLSPNLKKRPVFQPEQREPPQMLSPKPNNRPGFKAEPNREHQDSSDDDEWQYEKPQPLHKYLKNRNY